MSLELQSQDPIERMAQLAREATDEASFVALPKEALPSGTLIGEPHALVISDGKGNVEVKSVKHLVDEYRGKPAQREGTAVTTTLDSFIDLVNRHANQDTAVFVDANWRKPSFTAVIDYHATVSEGGTDKPDSTAGEDPHARNGKHRVAYAFPLSEPWKVWVAKNAEAMTQAEFAAFIEEHIHEIAAPNRQAEQELKWEELFRTKFADPSTLIDLARGLEIHESARVKSNVRLQSGEVQMVFETEHRDASGNEVTVPGLFLLAVPVFYRGEVLRIPVRLRYRVRAGGISWSYELFRPDEFVDEHVRKAVEQVRALTGLPVYDGAPESR